MDISPLQKSHSQLREEFKDARVETISDVNRLTLQDVLNLLELDKLPEGFYSPEEILAITQRIINEQGVERYWTERKFNLAQLEYLQTM